MIIDSHAHVGACRVFGAEQQPQALIEKMDAGGVDVSVVQPFPGSEDVATDHDTIAQMGRDNPGRVYGLASVNPHLGDRAYRDEVHRCVQELGFIAVKLHTIGHAVSPGSPDARLVFRTAAELGVPVMIHTGPGVPFAEPAAWIPMAREFAELPVILAHAGAGLYTGPAIVAAEVCDNIVLETSWCRPQDVGQAVTRLGADRVLFGSDLAFNIAPAIAAHDAVLSDDDRDTVMRRAPAALFDLSAGVA